MSKFKLVIFDMDGTLIKGRGIFTIAEKKGFIDDLWKFIKNNTMQYYEKSIEIAKLSKGFKKYDFIEIFQTVPLQDHILDVLKELKKRGIITAIATDSYQILADDLRVRLGIDYAFANNLITNNDIITGELDIHNKELKQDICNRRIYSICKSCVLEKLCKNLDIPLDQSMAIGDGIVDIGMIKKAGLGVAFNASEEVNKYADIVTNDLRTILDYI